MRKRYKFNSQFSCKGVHTLNFYDVSSERARSIEDKLNDLSSKKPYLKTSEENKLHWIEYNNLLKELERYRSQDPLQIENVTTTVGRSVLAQRLGGTTTYSGTINYTALGTDNTAATVGDATLGTETYRKALSSGTYSNNIAYLETFYTAAEVSGTFEEYGMFIDGTGTADTGQLFNRFTTTITKSGVETLNVQSVITINDA